MTELATAYDRCEAITRREARNFFYGIRLLPAPKRAAMSALYAFARRVDDIGDGAGTAREKLRGALGGPRRARPGAPATRLPAIRCLSRSPTRWRATRSRSRPSARSSPVARWTAARSGTRSFDELAVYCRCVAGSVGRLSLGVFGSADPAGAPRLADQLGIALQLTNILRDVVEDRDRMGRVYLPAEDLARFGCRDRRDGAGSARSSRSSGSRRTGRAISMRRA